MHDQKRSSFKVKAAVSTHIINDIVSASPRLSALSNPKVMRCKADLREAYFLKYLIFNKIDHEQISIEGAGNNRILFFFVQNFNDVSYWFISDR